MAIPTMRVDILMASIPAIILATIQDMALAIRMVMGLELVTTAGLAGTGVVIESAIGEGSGGRIPGLRFA